MFLLDISCSLVKFGLVLGFVLLQQWYCDNTIMAEASTSKGYGPFLATGGYDYTVRLWHIETGTCIKIFQHRGSAVNAIEVTPDKKKIATAGFQNIRIYDVNSVSDHPIQINTKIEKNITALSIGSNGNCLYTAGEDRTVRIWDIRNWSWDHRWLLKTKAPINSLSLHPDQRHVAVADQDGIVYLFDIRNRENVMELAPEHDAFIQSVAIDPKGRVLAAVNRYGNCFIWDLTREQNQPVNLKVSFNRTLHAHTRYGLRCRFNADSTLLATTSADPSCRVWRTHNYSLLKEFRLDSDRWMWDAMFTTDSRFIITGSSDNFARLWSLETGHVDATYSGHDYAVTCLALND